MANRKDEIEYRLYFPEIDGLRFFSFLLVFIHHHNLLKNIPYLSAIRDYGWIGVDLFLVISAFLFTKLLVFECLANGKISFTKFYIRRVLRIWPIYYIFISITILYFYIVNGKISLKILFRIVGLFSFSDNLITAVEGYNPIFFTPHLWTISYEEQFYIFIPIIIFLAIKSKLKIQLFSLVFIFVIFNGIRFYLLTESISHPAIWVLPITHFESIILGIVIGFGGFESLTKKLPTILLLLFGILSFILITKLPKIESGSFYSSVSYSLIGACTSLIFVSVLENKILKNIFSKELFIFLGKRSYGLYLFHLSGISLANYTVSNLIKISSNSIASFFLALFYTIVLGIVSYKVIETPFLKLKRKFEMVLSRPI